MTTYSIYFENQYGETQNYAFFCEPPAVTSTTGNPKVYSNVFLSQSVAQDGNWTIDVTNTYFAWSGTAPKPFAPGVKVTSGNGKLCRLGDSKGPGSTWTMYNNGGAPAFETKEKFTALDSSFEIDTGVDFTSDLNFLIGLGSVDANGRMKPAATMEAPRNAKVNIAPVTTFYIASFSSSVGTVINTSTISNQAALIDFTSNPGKFGATVVQKRNGEFLVVYQNTGFDFQQAVQSLQSKATVEAELAGTLQRLLGLLGPGVNPNLLAIWKCSVDWSNNPTAEDKDRIYKNLRNSMVEDEYTYFGDSKSQQGLVISFQKKKFQLTRAEVLADWNSAIASLLPASDRRLVTNPDVVEDPNDGDGDGATELVRKLKSVNGAARLIAV